MKPLANEKTCLNSAIGLEIESATCVGGASKSQGKAKPQVGSHTAEKERARHAKARCHARSDAKAEGRVIAGFTPLPQRPIDAFPLPHAQDIGAARKRAQAPWCQLRSIRRDVNFLLPTNVHRSAFVRYSSSMK